MKYRTLGKNLTVSAVGLGCMGMSHAYGEPADKKEMTELLAQAVDIGYTFFDTAEIYGTPDNEHDNEELVGAALKPFRDKIVIGTKFGIRFDWTSTATNLPVMTDSRPEVIKKSVEGSLKRLQTDHIDLYYQHRQDKKSPASCNNLSTREKFCTGDFPKSTRKQSAAPTKFVPSRRFKIVIR